jgi:hypothetical protein
VGVVQREKSKWLQDDWKLKQEFELVGIKE